MASRAEQKAAARALREQRHRELTAAQTRRTRLMWLGGLVVVAAVVVAVVIAGSSGGGGSKTGQSSSSADATALAAVNQLIGGIPQSMDANGDAVLGNPKAPVTVTEWGDLVCSTCDAFALDSEQPLITTEVRTGKAKLVYRAFDTASSYANEGDFVTGQAAEKAAGLQGLGWNYIMLNYEEQPHEINGQDSEEVSYYTTTYMQNLASQLKGSGLNLVKWQTNLTNSTLVHQVNVDGTSGTSAGVTGTPGVYVSGPGGSGLIQTNSYPTLAQLQSAIKQDS
jgi:protein-disulfide isomerase